MKNIFVAFAFLMLWNYPSLAEQNLKEVLSKTYKTNPKILSAIANLQANDERLKQVSSLWKPTLSSGASISKATTDSGFGFNQEGSTKTMKLDLLQPLYRGGRTGAAKEIAESDIVTAQINLLKIEQDVLLSAATSYMNITQNQELVKLQQSNRDILNKRLEEVKLRYDLGDVTKTDVAQARSRFLNAEADLIEAKGRLDVTKASFENITGLEPADNLDDKINLMLDIPKNLNDAVNIAMNNNPDILVISEQVNSAVSNVNLIKGERLPELNLQGNVTRSYTPTASPDDSTSITLSANMDLYTGGSVSSRIKQAKLRVNEQKINITDIKREVKEQAVTAWQNLKVSQSTIKARKEQVKSAELALKGVIIEEKNGVRTILDILDAEKEKLDAKTNLIIARHNEVLDKFKLLSKLGLLTSNNIGLEVK